MHSWSFIQAFPFSWENMLAFSNDLGMAIVFLFLMVSMFVLSYLAVDMAKADGWACFLHKKLDVKVKLGWKRMNLYSYIYVW